MEHFFNVTVIVNGEQVGIKIADSYSHSVTTAGETTYVLGVTALDKIIGSGPVPDQLRRLADHLDPNN